MAYSRCNQRIFYRPGNSGGKILGRALPLARNIVLQRYGHSVEAAQTCPGESNCEKWASSAGKDHAAKERNVCHGCFMFPTKSVAGKQEQANLLNLIDDSFRIRRERLMGYPRSLSKMTALEFEINIILDELIESEEFLLRRQIPEILRAGLGVNNEQ